MCKFHLHEENVDGEVMFIMAGFSMDHRPKIKKEFIDEVEFVAEKRSREYETLSAVIGDPSGDSEVSKKSKSKKKRAKKSPF